VKRNARAEPARSNYSVQSVTRAIDLLRAFRSDEELLALRDLVGRTGLNKTTAYRLIQTLCAAGAVERVGPDHYRALIRTIERMKFRFGFAAKSRESQFSLEIERSLREAAAARGIDLVVLDNRDSPTNALRNADKLVREQVQLAIEFQAHDRVAPEVASKFLEAKIPLIAVEIPHPGAIYFGGNNFEAGRISGRALATRARQLWQGAVDEVLLVEMSSAGPLPQTCLTGAASGIREVLRDIEESRFIRLDGKGRFGPSLDIVRKHMRRSRARRFLVGAVNDSCALGAIRAFEESGKGPDCLVSGQNATIEARNELRRPATRMVGSVAFFPEEYGEGLVRLGLDILNDRPAPPAVFVKHILITSQNVNRYYPNDSLLT